MRIALFGVLLVSLLLGACTPPPAIGYPVAPTLAATSTPGELLPTPTPSLPIESTPTLTNPPDATATRELDTPSSLSLTNLASIPAWQRAGFGISSTADASAWGSVLGAGWYLDWNARPSLNETIERWNTVRITATSIKPSLAEIRRIAQADPGRVWIIGNEPDVIWQDNVTAERFAFAYHEVATALRQADPSVMIAMAGVSQVTPLRLEYLDRVLAAYRQVTGETLPVDWWTVHIYVLREERDSWGVDIPPGFDVDAGLLYEVEDHARLDLIEQQLRDFRAWMAANGYQDTPLAVTEYGILMPPDYGFPPEMVADYLQQTFDLFYTLKDVDTGLAVDDYRLVQRWAWFSLSDTLYPAPDLANLPAGELTTLGLAFRQAVAILTPVERTEWD